MCSKIVESSESRIYTVEDFINNPHIVESDNYRICKTKDWLAIGVVLLVDKPVEVVSEDKNNHDQTPIGLFNTCIPTFAESSENYVIIQNMHEVLKNFKETGSMIKTQMVEFVPNQTINNKHFPEDSDLKDIHPIVEFHMDVVQDPDLPDSSMNGLGNGE